MTNIYLEGVVGIDITAAEVKELMAAASGDIYFDLNSGGGYVTEGVAILNTIRAYNKGKTVAKIHYAASMMTQIALACDEVHAYDNSIFMIHNVQGMAYGDHNAMFEQGEKQKRMSKMLASLYVKKTGMSEDEIKTMMDNDTYLFGEEIVEKGFADMLIETNHEKNFEQQKEVALVNFKKSMEAMNSEKITAEQLDSFMAKCNDNCSVEAHPTAASDNSKNFDKGESMELPFNEDNFKALNAAYNSEKGRAAEAQTALETAKEELAAKDGEIAQLNEAHATALVAAKEEAAKEATEAAQKAIFDRVEARVSEAVASNVTKADVIIAMVKAEDDAEASKIAIEANASDGSISHADGEVGKESGLMAFAQKHKGMVK